jgi:hypothetical protein
MRVVLVLAVGLGLSACATGVQRTGQRQTDLITYQEMEPLRVPTAFDVVQQLRPEFLRTRGSASVRDPTPVEAVVYLDGVRLGAPSALRGIPKETLKEIRYMDANEATMQYGTGHRGGAIVVTTR